MSFVVLYDTASASDAMIVDPPTGIVVLGPGVREGMISVRVAEDEMPEESETLRIQLTSTTGEDHGSLVPRRPGNEARTTAAAVFHSHISSPIWEWY